MLLLFFFHSGCKHIDDDQDNDDDYSVSVCVFISLFFLFSFQLQSTILKSVNHQFVSSFFFFFENQMFMLLLLLLLLLTNYGLFMKRAKVELMRESFFSTTGKKNFHFLEIKSFSHFYFLSDSCFCLLIINIPTSLSIILTFRIYQ